MAKADRFEDLMFMLGDLARDRLAHKASRPNSMERVFKSEAAVVLRRQELEALEAKMNDEDGRYHASLEADAAEKVEKVAVARRFRGAVEAVEGRVKGLRKQLSSLRISVRIGQDNLRKAQDRIQASAAQGMDAAKVAALREGLKRQRLAHMRLEREAEERELELKEALTPDAKQPGAEGILAHRRVFELEEQEERQKFEFEAQMAELEAAVAEKEEQVHAAEDFLDQALYLLGEECYATRLADPELAVFYPRLDKAG